MSCVLSPCQYTLASEEEAGSEPQVSPTERLLPVMDTAELQEFIGLVGALCACQKKGTNPLRRMKASGELLDFFKDYPVFTTVAELSPILEEAKRIN